jgi:hypothetical protein
MENQPATFKSGIPGNYYAGIAEISKFATVSIETMGSTLVLLIGEGDENDDTVITIEMSDEVVSQFNVGQSVSVKYNLFMDSVISIEQ